jgi:beta-glucuronidase
MIGFRNVFVKGTDIYLNDKPIFLKSVSFHEEIPQREGRAFSEADAAMLLSEAKALGCNMIRLAHYPQNEYTVRMAEKMGFLLWEEIPIWQGINFDNVATKAKAGNMIKEMVQRDKNRCALAFWGVANETQPSTARNEFLKYLIASCHEIDTTRLITAAFDLVRFNKEKGVFEMNDSFIKELDVVAVNKYMGWYHPWPVSPEKAIWNVAPGQPLLITEFGGEALYGLSGDEEVASSWSEEYQAKLYRDNIKMFANIPNLRGVSPWVLFDFRSPFRFHPTNQDGWNRKGLVSDQGLRKKAWYIMKDYYNNK